MLLVLAGLAATAAAAWLVAPRLHRFAYWIGRTDLASLQPLASDGWQLHELPVADGLRLVGLLRPPQAADARWVLFVPGNATAVLAGFRPVLDDLRGDRDLGFAFWAMRGFDASDGIPNPAALRADLLRQWQHLRSLGVPAERIEILGYSLGTPLALQLAADLAARGERPARVVLAAASPRIPVMRHGAFGRFQADDVYEVAGDLPQVPGPVLVLHGTADLALPLADARALVAALGDRATLLELPGRGHVDLWPDVAARAFR